MASRTRVHAMRSWKPAARLALLVLAALSRLGCDAAVQTTPGCSSLEACCETLGGADESSCEASAQASGVTDEECLELLAIWQGQGSCVPASAVATADAGSGLDATIDECGALGACCARIADAGLAGCASVLSNPSSTQAECQQELLVLQEQALCSPNQTAPSVDAGGGGGPLSTDAGDGGVDAMDASADACDDPQCVDDCNDDPECLTSCGC
jgi:hypothetical protein